MRRQFYITARTLEVLPRAYPDKRGPVAGCPPGPGPPPSRDAPVHSPVPRLPATSACTQDGKGSLNSRRNRVGHILFYPPKTVYIRQRWREVEGGSVGLADRGCVARCLGLIVTAGSSLVSDLATRLMLEPGVMITNSLLMASAGIASNLEKSRRSLVWHGLKRGLIVPDFREKGAVSSEDITSGEFRQPRPLESGMTRGHAVRDHAGHADRRL